MEKPVAHVDELQMKTENIKEAKHGTTKSLSSPPHEVQEEKESEAHVQDDSPGADPEPADEKDWQARAQVAEERVAELGDRLGAVESAAEDLRRMVAASEQARHVDRELLIAGVVDLDGARALVEEQIAAGSTVVEAVAQVKERRPLLFVTKSRGIRATMLPAVEGERGRSVEEVAEAARETGDRRLLLRYLRMRRGDRD